MQNIVHRAESRGQSKYDWLDSKHNFSFAGYSDRERVHFGALRVLNDDIVQPGTGFGRHPHENMEIISIPIKGALLHKDSMNHEQVIKENEVQVMSAGTGIFHSEYNASKTEEVNFLQIWIYPDEKNVVPVYDQKFFDPELAKNKWQTLVTSIGNPAPGTLTIHQKAKISRILIDKDSEVEYSLMAPDHGIFLFVIEGEAEIGNDKYFRRDAVGMTNVPEIKIKAVSDTYLLNIEVPDL